MKLLHTLRIFGIDVDRRMEGGRLRDIVSKSQADASQEDESTATSHIINTYKILRPNCKMKFSIVALVATAEAGTASSNWSNVRRHLSFEKVAGYEPGSQVCTLDCSVAFISVAGVQIDQDQQVVACVCDLS